MLVIQKHIPSPANISKLDFLQKQLTSLSRYLFSQKSPFLRFWEGSKYASENTLEVKSVFIKTINYFFIHSSW